MFRLVQLTDAQIETLHDIVSERLQARKNQLVTAVEGIAETDTARLHTVAVELSERADEIRGLGDLFAVTNIAVMREVAERRGEDLPDVFPGRA